MLRTVELEDVLAISEQKPVLVAFIRRGRSASGQIETMEMISRRHGPELYCCLYSFKNIELGMRHFGVRGIPSFLVVLNGREVDRFIGLAEPQDMERLARNGMQASYHASFHGGEELFDFD
jgi:hypothetical protein